MHELPVINSILSVVLKHAAVNHVKKVVTIFLQVGALSDLEDKWMQQYFDYVGKGSIAEGATLKIERIPAVMQCRKCSETYEVNVKGETIPPCPECGSDERTLVSGREYFIKNMEVI